MDRSKYLLTILGLVLGVAGLLLFNFGSVPEKTSAAAYTTTWTATKVVTVDAVVGGVPVGKAGIGVWEWFVSGSIGGTSFTETWSAPSLTGVFFAPVSVGCSITGVDETKILAGCFADQNDLGGPDTSNYSFGSRDPASYSSNISRLNVGTGTQKTVSCINSPRNSSETECLFQSGSYSFQHVYEPGHPSRSRWVGGGTLMPLEWTVSGNIL